MFEKVDIHSLSFNPFDKIGKDWNRSFNSNRFICSNNAFMWISL